MTKPRYVIAAWAILVIGVLEVIALHKGIDGPMFAAASAGVGAIAGYVIKDRRA